MRTMDLTFEPVDGGECVDDVPDVQVGRHELHNARTRGEQASLDLMEQMVQRAAAGAYRGRSHAQVLRLARDQSKRAIDEDVERRTGVAVPHGGRLYG